MLDFFFSSAVRRRQLRRGPLAEHIDGFAGELHRNRFACNTACRILSVAGQFSAFAGLVGARVEDVDESLVDRFLATQLNEDGLFQDGPTALRHMLRYLRAHSIIAPPPAPAPHPFSSVFDAFDRYLRDVRGLASTTRAAYVATARELVDWLRAKHGDRALTRMAGTDVLEFITGHLGRCANRSTRAHLCSNIRGVLRFLHGSGATAADLSRVVPKIASPQLARLPRGLPWDQVRALIDGVDTSHPDGMRDKAILLLLATLGLRSCEV